MTIATGALALALAASTPAHTVVVTAAHLVDPAAGSTLNDPTIVVTDGRIVTVRTRGQAMSSASRTRRIDLPGGTLLLSLIERLLALPATVIKNGVRVR